MERRLVAQAVLVPRNSPLGCSVRLSALLRIAQQVLSVKVLDDFFASNGSEVQYREKGVTISAFSIS